MSIPRGEVTFTVRTVARSAKRQELLQALMDWAAMVRAEADVRHAYVYQDVEAPDAFGLVSEWATAATLVAHLQSDAFGVFAGALRVLGEPSGLRVLQANERLRVNVARAIGQPWPDEGTDAEPS